VFTTTFYNHLIKLQENLCPDKNFALMITNINTENMDTVHYCAVFDPTFIMYALRNPFKKNVLRFDLSTKKLTRNGKEISIENLQDFVSKLASTIEDAKNNTARTYQKPSEIYTKKPTEKKVIA